MAKVTVSWQPTGYAFTVEAEAGSVAEVLALVHELEAALGPSDGAEDNKACPVHKLAKPSKHGGLYCPAKLDNGSWCQWKAKD